MKEQEIRQLKDRLYDYQKAINRISPGQGFCHNLPKDLTKENYPELWKYKPWYVIHHIEHGFINPIYLFSSYWFGIHKYRKRVYILRDIAEDLTIKIETEEKRQKEIKDRLDDLLETNRKLAEKRKELNKLKNLT